MMHPIIKILFLSLTTTTTVFFFFSPISLPSKARHLLNTAVRRHAVIPNAAEEALGGKVLDGRDLAAARGGGGYGGDGRKGGAVFVWDFEDGAEGFGHGCSFFFIYVVCVALVLCFFFSLCFYSFCFLRRETRDGCFMTCDVVALIPR